MTESLMLPLLTKPDGASDGRLDDLTPSRVDWLVVIAASVGGVEALKAILGKLAQGLPAALVLLQHRSPGNHLVELLRKKTALPVHIALQGELILPGNVYLAQSDSHLTITADHRFAYHNGSKIRFVRSSANPLMESASRVFGARCLAVVLSGSGHDATDGVQSVKAHGGLVIAQDQATSEIWRMPESAIRTGAVDYVLPLGAIAPALDAIIRGHAVAHPRRVLRGR